MMYENDKLNIPEEYRNMSVSELRYEKERVYSQIRRGSCSGVIKKADKREMIMFQF